MPRVTDHTRTEKIGGDSILIFVVNQVVTGNRYDSLATPLATVFVFILGLGPICDEFRIWTSNLVCFYFVKSSSHYVLVICFMLIVVLCLIVTYA